MFSVSRLLLRRSVDIFLKSNTSSRNVFAVLFKKQLEIASYDKSRGCHSTGPSAVAPDPIEDSSKKFQLVFRCKKCNTVNKKVISKVAYYKGIVVVKCDGCANNHLIADNLGWFQNSSGKNVEEMLAAKGETVKRGLIEEGLIEITQNKNKT